MVVNSKDGGLEEQLNELSRLKKSVELDSEGSVVGAKKTDYPED